MSGNIVGRIDEMGKRIDDIEKQIENVMKDLGQEEEGINTQARNQVKIK